MAHHGSNHSWPVIADPDFHFAGPPVSENSRLAREQFSENSRLARDQFADTTKLAHNTADLQYKQFEENRLRAKRDADDTAFRGILSMAKSTQGPEVVFSMALLKPFFDSEQYKTQAREISVVILARIPDPGTFRLLFPELVKRTNWGNVDDLMSLARTLNVEERIAYKKREALKNSPVNPISRFLSPSSEPRDTPEAIEEAVNGFSREMQYVSEAIAEFLQDSRNYPAPDGTRLNFQGVQLTGGTDLSGLSLGGAVFEDATLFRCNLSDTDLSGVESFDNSEWKGTAWWRAKAIHPGLLNYLMEEYPFDAKDADYFGGIATQGEYEEAIRRLRAELTRRPSTSTTLPATQPREMSVSQSPSTNRIHKPDAAGTER